MVWDLVNKCSLGQIALHPRSNILQTAVATWAGRTVLKGSTTTSLLRNNRPPLTPSDAS